MCTTSITHMCNSVIGATCFCQWGFMAILLGDALCVKSILCEYSCINELSNTLRKGYKMRGSAEDFIMFHNDLFNMFQ